MRTPLALLVILLLAPLLCPALTGQVLVNMGGTSASSERFPLQGSVIDSVTGEPVRHALVQVHIEGAHSAFTDDQGMFRFARLPRATLMLTAVKPGYRSNQSFSSRSRPQMVTIGPDIPPVTLKLTPESQIYGTISDDNGDGLGSVPLRLFRFQVEEGIKKLVPVNQTQSNEKGGYQFFDLAEGDYVLGAGPSTPDMNNPFLPGVSAESFYLQSFYPNAPDIASATPFHVAAGKKQQIDMSLSSGRTFVVSVTITGANPQATSIQYINSSGQEAALTQRRVSLNGFTARVGGGPLLIKAYFNNGQGMTLYGEASLDVSSDLTDVRIALSPSSVIPVNVQRFNAAGAPIDTSQAGPPQVRLISLDRLHQDVWAQTTGGPGNWMTSLINVQSGRYRVAIPDADWYPESITSGGIDLKTEPLVVTPGSSQPIEVTLRNDPAQLQVKIESKDVSSVAPAMVIAVPEGGSWKQKVGITFGNRQASYFALPPGRYSIYAFQDFDDLEYGNPEVMKEFAGSATKIELQPKQQTTITVPLTRKSQ